MTAAYRHCPNGLKFQFPGFCFTRFRFLTCSDAVESVSSLYNHVEEQAHVLVQRTNLSLEHLEYLLQLREFQVHFMQVHSSS